MADEIVYVTVNENITEVIEIETETPEPLIVDVLVNDFFEGFTFVESTTPTATADGQTWHNPSTNKSYVQYGSTWKLFSDTKPDTNYSEIGSWVPITEFLNGWYNVPGEQPLEIRAEGPYVRVRGVIKRSLSSPAVVCNLPSWASSYGSYIIPCFADYADTGYNNVGSLRIRGNVLFVDSDGGAPATQAHDINIRYLRKPPTFPIDTSSGHSPFMTSGYGKYLGASFVEWALGGVNLWNGQASYHGLWRVQDSAFIPTGSVAPLAGYPMSTTDGKILIQQGLSVSSTFPATQFSRLDIDPGNSRLYGQHITDQSSIWFSVSGLEWVTAITNPLVIAPTLLNGWSNYGLSYSLAGIIKIDDVVFIQGLLTRTGTSSAPMFILPSEYRPPKTMRFAVYGATSSSTKYGSSALRLIVEPSGEVYNDSAGYMGAGYFSICCNFSVTP